MSAPSPRTPPDDSTAPPARAGRAGWALPASSAFFAVSLATAAGIWAGPGCQTACEGDFDCVGAGYCDQSSGRCLRDCFTDEDCRTPPGCKDNPAACRPLGLYCSGSGRCQGPITVEFEGVTREAPRAGGPRFIEGWDFPPGVGYAYIIDQIGLGERDQGFDLDGNCDEDGCVDNVLAPLGDLANDQIRQGLLGGESLLLIELAGLDDDPFTGYDESFTIKIYGAEDADEPFFPANNFAIPPGHDTCCEFKINGESLVSPPPQARARAPAELDRGRLRSLAPVPIQFTLTVGAEPHPVVRLERVLMTGRLGRDLGTIEDGLLGGAIPVSTLYATENPYCKTSNARCPTSQDGEEFQGNTLLDLVVALLRPDPDIDLDFDGRECLIDSNGDGQIDICCDGRGPGAECNSEVRCPGEQVPPADPDDPSSCARPADIDDGYSLSLTFSALRARIVGSGE